MSTQVHKTLDEKIPGGKLLFLSSGTYPVIQYEARGHRHEVVTSDKSGMLVGDSWLLDKAIAANSDINFVLMNDSLLSAMESIYWTLVDKFQNADAVKVEKSVDIVYRLKDMLVANYGEYDVAKDIEDVAILLEAHKLSLSKATNMVKSILTEYDIFDLVAVRSYWNELMN